MKTPKVFLYLNGGLGNQLFQYACARSISLRQGAELVLDDWSGFVRDRQYRRDYELGAFPIQARVVKPWERIPIWLFRWKNRLIKQRPGLIEKRWYGQFCSETELRYLSQLKNAAIESDVWIKGYWQSPKYFSEYSEILRRELMPPPAQRENFAELAKLIYSTESVAVGIRLYEEANDPKIYSRDGKMKTKAQIRGAISRLLTLHPKAKFFLFCTHHSNFLYELGLPNDTVYVTSDEGYDGAIETLWLLTQCRHHIFTNSSFYWWGAWLSAAVRGGEGQTILAADNFYNRDGLCPEWETF